MAQQSPQTKLSALKPRSRQVVSQDRLNLPWTVEVAERRRFRSLLAVLFVLLIGVSIWIPLIELPEPEREELEKLPPQLARIVEQEKPEPPPSPPPEPEPAQEPEPEKAPEPEPAPPEPKPEPKPAPEPPKKEPPPSAKVVKEAREVAKKSGLLALQSDLADLRSAVDVSALRADQEIRAQETVAASAKAIDQTVLASRSAGINTDNMAQPAETVALADHQTSRLTETDAERALAAAEAQAAQRRNVRSDESIQYTNEKLKAPLITLYNRELRKDPFLEGRLEMEVVIEPSGEVSYCRVMNSELNHKTLETKLCNRVLLADYGAENVARITISIPFNFQPN